MIVVYGQGSGLPPTSMFGLLCARLQVTGIREYGSSSSFVLVIRSGHLATKIIKIQKASEFKDGGTRPNGSITLAGNTM